MSDDVIVLLREDHREPRRDRRAFMRTERVNTAKRGLERIAEGHTEALARADAADTLRSDAPG